MPGSLFNEGKCYQCGRPFIMSDPKQWKLKLKINYKTVAFCSWRCLEKARKAKEETGEGKKHSYQY